MTTITTKIQSDIPNAEEYDDILFLLQFGEDSAASRSPTACTSKDDEETSASPLVAGDFTQPSGVEKSRQIHTKSLAKLAVCNQPCRWAASRGLASASFARSCACLSSDYKSGNKYPKRI